MVRRGGGTRHVEHNAAVTYVVVGKILEREAKRVKAIMAGGGAEVVWSSWLRECDESCARLPVEARHRVPEIVASGRSLWSDGGGSNGNDCAAVVLVKESSRSASGSGRAGDSGAGVGSPLRPLAMEGDVFNTVFAGLTFAFSCTFPHEQASHCPRLLPPPCSCHHRLQRLRPCLGGGGGAQKAEVKAQVLQGSGTIHSERCASAAPDFLICPHGQPPPADAAGPLCVSLHWEEWLHDAGAHVLFRPVHQLGPLPGLGGAAKLCFSQYGAAELSRAKFLCKDVLHAKWTEKLSRQVTHLVVPTRSGEKYLTALKWGLKIVTIEWLYACTRENKLLLLDGFQPRELLPAEREGRMLALTQNPTQAARLAAGSAGDLGSQWEPESTLDPAAGPPPATLANELDAQFSGAGPSVTALDRRRPAGAAGGSTARSNSGSRRAAGMGAGDAWEAAAQPWSQVGSSRTTGGGGGGGSQGSGRQPAAQSAASSLVPPRQQPSGEQSQQRHQRRQRRQVLLESSDTPASPSPLTAQAAATAAALDREAAAILPLADASNKVAGGARRGASPRLQPPAKAAVSAAELAATPRRDRRSREADDAATTAGFSAVQSCGYAVGGNDDSPPDVAAAIEGLLAQTTKSKKVHRSLGPVLYALVAAVNQFSGGGATQHSCRHVVTLQTLSPELNEEDRRRSAEEPRTRSDHKRAKWQGRSGTSRRASLGKAADEDDGRILESQMDSQIVRYDEDNTGRQQIIERARTRSVSQSSLALGLPSGQTREQEGGGYHALHRLFSSDLHDASSGHSQARALVAVLARVLAKQQLQRVLVAALGRTLH
eukprot:SM000002S05744  [mRNA]  locus=s2:1902052:1908507:- [translate_table: standard]